MLLSRWRVSLRGQAAVPTVIRSSSHAHADYPQALGRTVYKDYPIEDVLDYIDWNPFFQVGMLCLLRRNV